jgi:hypothetical protein
MSFNNLKILYAITDQTNLKQKNKKLFYKMFDMTFYSILKFSKENIVFCQNIDECLKYADDYDLIFFQNVGNFIVHKKINNLLLKYYLTNKDFFILAFVLDWEAELGYHWLECHHQMLFLNVKKWQELKRPFFGNWEVKTEMLPCYTRSEENFHDKYTPYWIKAKNSEVLKTRTKQGWNFIKTALNNNLKIDNFSQETRDCRLYVYPETNTEELYHSLETNTTNLLKNPNQKKLISSINTITNQVWAYNSEKYSFYNKSDNIRTYFGPASGFKYLKVLENNENVKFIFYDFNIESLEWIKKLKENWNGKDYPKFLNAQDNKNITYTKTIDENEKTLFQELPMFRELWRKFRKSEIVFIKTDLLKINEVKNLLNQETKKERALFCFSNIFFNDLIIFKYSLNEIIIKYNNFLNNIRENYEDNIVLEGCDPFGKWIINNPNMDEIKEEIKKIKDNTNTSFKNILKLNHITQENSR